MGLVNSYSNNGLRGQELRRLLQIPDQPVRSDHRPLMRRARQLPDDEIARLVADYEAGVLVDDIALKCGTRRGTVTEIMKTTGRRVRCKGLSDPELAQATELYEGGASLATVGREGGIDAMTIRTWLLRAGVRIRPRNGWPPPA